MRRTSRNRRSDGESSQAEESSDDGEVHDCVWVWYLGNLEKKVPKKIKLVESCQKKVARRQRNVESLVEVEESKVGLAKQKSCSCK
jgi:hypothetical protein